MNTILESINMELESNNLALQVKFQEQVKKTDEQAEIIMQVLRKLEEIDIKTIETKYITESQIRNNKTREHATTNNTEFNNETSLFSNNDNNNLWFFI